MLFSSIFFIFTFLPILLIIYSLTPMKFKNYVLFGASILFYSWGEPINVLLMIFSIGFNYLMAKDIAKERKLRKYISLIFTICVNLMILSFFKYYGFALETVNSIFGTEITYTALPLPIGISFYTFQAMSYIIDVHRDKVSVQKSPIQFGLYLSLFPQLIAGPIVKYKDIEDQLNDRKFSIENIGSGSVRFILGLGKKVILANSFGALHMSILSMPSEELSVLSMWLGAIAYTLQIYYDFSGYSDMAIGLGKMFGFEFMENFNYPYVARSITDFWRRWHISLSTWFREYLYIPLGGNRVSKSRHILNLLIVWSLTGLWHGASWNFVVWGIYYGIMLIIEKYFLSKYLTGIPAIFQHLYTLIIVIVGWVFFFSNNLGDAINYLQSMFALGDISISNASFMYLIKTESVLILVGILLSARNVYEKFINFSKSHYILGSIVLVAIFFISISYLVFSSYNPFLYFRF